MEPPLEFCSNRLFTQTLLVERVYRERISGAIPNRPLTTKADLSEFKLDLYQPLH